MPPYNGFLYPKNQGTHGMYASSGMLFLTQDLPFSRGRVRTLSGHTVFSMLHILPNLLFSLCNSSIGLQAIHLKQKN